MLKINYISVVTCEKQITPKRVHDIFDIPRFFKDLKIFTSHGFSEF